MRSSLHPLAPALLLPLAAMVLSGCPPVPDSGKPDDTAADSGVVGDTFADTADTADDDVQDSDSDCGDDLDGDGYCSGDDDCNDADPGANPGATEVCDEVDNDCDGSIDEGVSATYYVDADGDGYGNGDAAESLCAPEEGYTDNGADCNDDDETVHPDQDDLANGVDDDCDDSIDEDAPATPEVTVTWSRSGVKIDVTGSASAWEFGMAETGAGSPGWFGESCIAGSEPWGYPDYGWDVCHTLGATGGTLTTTSDIYEVVDGITLFSEPLADNITYVIIDGDSGDCWSFGNDPTYYDLEGCDAL